MAETLSGDDLARRVSGPLEVHIEPHGNCIQVPAGETLTLVATSLGAEPPRTEIAAEIHDGRPVQVFFIESGDLLVDLGAERVPAYEYPRAWTVPPEQRRREQLGSLGAAAVALGLIGLVASALGGWSAWPWAAVSGALLLGGLVATRVRVERGP